MTSAIRKSVFALFFGNRGFFPGSVIASAREEMTSVLKGLGYDTISLDAGATRYGAVETRSEGETYDRFLEAHRGQFNGVILCLPNFGDENGAVVALRNAGVPILVQSYPDDLDKMGIELRRDAFCGKLSIMDVFHQNRIPFTALKPHTVSPSSKAFAANVDYFNRVCRVVNDLKGMVVGAVGARTSAFKTVRIDETALQRHGITVETFDLSDVFARMSRVKETDETFQNKAQVLKAYADFSQVPQEAFEKIIRLAVVLDSLVDEYRLDAVAVRCWLEMQEQLGISPCVIMSEMNDRLISTSCEVDVGNAVAMYALSRASGSSAACLDWNNNYGDNEDKCIIFHCGPVPNSMMAERGQVVDHAILAKVVGPDRSFGCNVGRIKPQPLTFSSLTTDSGRLKFYLGEGQITEDPVPTDFFGCPGVAHIPRLQDVLLHIGREGHRHHVSATTGHIAAPLKEALEYYLGFDVSVPQG